MKVDRCMKQNKGTIQKKESKAAWLKEIVIDEALNYVDEKGKPIDILKGLSPINVFVGPTSTGKTRLMRNICSLKDPKVKWGGVENDLCQKRIDELCNKYQETIKKGGFNPETKKLLDALPGTSFIKSFNELVCYLTEHTNASLRYTPSTILYGNSGFSFSRQLRSLEDNLNCRPIGDLSQHPQFVSPFAI